MAEGPARACLRLPCTGLARCGARPAQLATMRSRPGLSAAAAPAANACTPFLRLHALPPFLCHTPLPLHSLSPCAAPSPPARSLDDSSILHPGYNLTLVPGLAPIEPAPMALAVARGNTQLADK